ncbi:MAG: hypothetical protein KDC98_26025 [Planctomycetes bacterium]|nr:hypothetical protein [Planctomycetota bacterium]
MTTLKIPVTEPIVGLRLHGASRSAAVSQRSTWLLSLRDREKQRRADSMALHAFAAAATDAFETLPRIIGERLDGIAEIAVELGLAIAREIVGDALDRGHVDPTATVARCLRDCVHGSSAADLNVYLHAEDLATVEANLAGQPEVREQLAKARLLVDPGIGRGAVRAETEAGRLQYDPRQALERVSAEVRREVRREGQP